MQVSGAIALLSCVMAVTAAAQGRGTSVGGDPYTLGDAERIAKAGYVAVGDLQWTADHASHQVEEMLGQLPYCWIETEHFRICSTLPEFSVGPSKQRKRLGKELKRLRKKLPTVKARTRTLDPWLRAHLIAQRCEDLYADFSKRAAVTDASFPKEIPRNPVDRDMGSGPFLGQRGKFLVMVFAQKATYARYTERFFQGKWDFSRRLEVKRDGSLWFGTAIELQGEMMGDDDALQAHIVYNVVCNLVDGFKEYRHETPTWLRYGIASWYLRDTFPDRNLFERTELVEADVRHVTDWARRVFKLVKNGGATSLHSLTTRMSPQEFKFRDYIVSWSIIDYLMSMHPKEFALLLAHYKAPLPGYLKTGTPRPAELLQHQSRAMEASLASDSDRLETAWSTWVKKAYRRR